MKRTVRYALAGLLACLVGIAAIAPWLGGPSRYGLVVAAGLAWVVQVSAFAALVRFRESAKGFLAAWVGGTVVRMALVLVAAWAVVRFPELPPAPTLLGLAGFFFGLLLLEPFFFGPGGEAAPGTNAHAPSTGRPGMATMDTA